MSDAKFGTFEDLMAMTAEGMQPIAEALRALTLEVDPDATEVVRLGDRAATYGVGPKKMSEGYVYVLPYSKHVNFGFYKGAALDDPAELLEGTGAKMRHVKVRTLDAASRPELRALVQAALSERKEALGR